MRGTHARKGNGPDRGGTLTSSDADGLTVIVIKIKLLIVLQKIQTKICQKQIYNFKLKHLVLKHQTLQGMSL